MSSPRLLVLAAIAVGCAAFPASGAAALTQDSATKPMPIGYGADGNGAPLWTSDNVLSPGESVNVNFPLRDTANPEPYTGDATGILYPQGSNGVFLGVSPSGANPFVESNGTVQGASPYAIAVSSGLQCGTRIPLRLAVSGPTMPAGSQDFLYGLPTGGVGAYHRTPSLDVGNIVYDGQTKDSIVDVKQSALTKGIRVHIDQLDHQYSTYWLKITLISPSGKEAVLIDQVGTTQGQSSTPNRHFHNVTFSTDAVNGQEPIAAADAAVQDFSDVVIRPKGSFSVFDGESMTGNWKLRVTDITTPKESRKLTGRTLSGGQMFELGNWQLDTAGPVCSTSPASSPAGPDAWFGSDPLVIDPAGGTLDAGASVDASFGGSVVKYDWDLDGVAGTGTEGFETSLTDSTATLNGPMAQAKRTIRLRVTDNSGKVSEIVSRDVFITKAPVISSVTANPAQIMAGTPVKLTAAATDADLPSGSALTYSWDLNDDGIFTDAAGATIDKTWPNSGLQMVRVKVTDNIGAYAIYNQNINVSNTAPTAAFKVGSSPVIAGEEVTFDASTSGDVDGTIVNYSWDFNGDGEFGDVSGPTSTAKWTFPTRGENSISLKVTDNTGGTGQLDMMIDVTGRPVPVGTATPSSPLKGETVTFNAAESHDVDAGGSIARYEWDLDGNNTFEINSPTAITATKSYPNAGTIIAKLRVTDNLGATAMQLIAITVRNPDVVTPATTPATTPKPTTPTTGGGGGTVPSTGPSGEKTPEALQSVSKGVDPITLGCGGFCDAPGSEKPSDGGVTDDGFAAKIAASSKAKGSKVYKKGIAVKLITNDASTLVLKVMVTPKDAKTMGLKIKANTSIGSGKLVTKGAGTGKFVVIFNKKYQRYVKKAKKTKVTFRAVVKSKSADSQLALARDITLVK